LQINYLLLIYKSDLFFSVPFIAYFSLILLGFPLMNRRIFLVFFHFSVLALSSQSFMRPNEWKKFRRELFVTMGTANFLGDLGGRDQKGTDYSPADLNFSQTRTAFGVGARYKLERVVNAAAKFSFLQVSGDDAKTGDRYRNNRNLNFKSNILELSARMEYGYQSVKRGGNRYGIMQTYGRMRNFTHNAFVFAGLGVFYFNPKGRTIEGKWIKLYPLHTEGQGLPGGPKQYKRVSVSFPVGAYYKLTLNKIWSFGIELSFRKTLSDYIDDVGSVYYSKAALEAAYGLQSAQMADPSRGDIYGATLPAADGTPAQRGDRQKDSFMSLEITGSYIFKQQRRSARLRSKF
jgi:hypothetical protein